MLNSLYLSVAGQVELERKKRNLQIYKSNSYKYSRLQMNRAMHL